MKEAATGQTGVLTIGAISSAMVEVLPRFLEKLRGLQPRMTISVREIDSAEAVPALASGEVDLAFARLQGDLGAAITTMTLSNDRLVVALPASHRLAGNARVKLSALADEEFVMFARRVSPVYFDSIIAVCRERGFSPRILHDVRSVVAQIAFVGCGQGIALVPSGLKRFAPENVVFKALTEKVEVVTMAAAWREDRTNPSLAAALDVLRRGKPP